MYRRTPNSDNFINYGDKKSAKNIRCISCGDWKTAATFVNGVCANCDQEFKNIKAKDIHTRTGMQLKTGAKLRVPKGI